ncbi:Helicase associated domain protein [Streptomyces canus]|uniref:Helicase associated domain protein n=1 Tax=Streptomyces canus TaxID=58343 RepID=UPI0036A27CEE
MGDELTAAKQFYEREGHLQGPRKHIERIVGEDQEEREHRLGAWIGNQRSSAATLTDGAAVRDRDAVVLKMGGDAQWST